MRYTKTKVNKIIDRIIDAVSESDSAVGNDIKLLSKISMIKEEYLLVDRRVSSLPEYTSEIIHDFINNQHSYKELMKKYHCSFRTLMVTLNDGAVSDDRIRDEIELRRH